MSKKLNTTTSNNASNMQKNPQKLPLKGDFTTLSIEGYRDVLQSHPKKEAIKLIITIYLLQEFKKIYTKKHYGDLLDERGLNYQLICNDAEKTEFIAFFEKYYFSYMYYNINEIISKVMPSYALTKKEIEEIYQEVGFQNTRILYRINGVLKTRVLPKAKLLSQDEYQTFMNTHN